MSDSEQQVGFVVGEVQQPESGNARTPADVRKRKKIFIVVAVLVLLGIGTMIFVKSNSPVMASGVHADDLSDDYMRLTDAEVARKFEAKTGLDVSNITDKSISGWRLKTFDQAYQAAQALQALGDYSKSVDAFELADAKSDGKASYLFYAQYSDALVFDKQVQKSIEILNKEKSAIDNDKTLSAGRKQVEKENIDHAILVRQRGN